MFVTLSSSEELLKHSIITGTTHVNSIIIHIEIVTWKAQLLYERVMECNNEIMQAVPSTHWKRKLLRTELREIDSRKKALSSPTEVINLLKFYSYNVLNGSPFGSAINHSINMSKRSLPR